MEFTVEVAIETKAPITEDVLADVAEVGGAAAGHIGENRVETTLTVKGKNHLDAAKIGVERILKLAPGRLVAVSVMDTDEADRRLAVRTEFLGLTEVARMLGVSKQRVHVLSARDDFPAPVAKLAAGPVWRAGDLSTFSAGWKRKGGRPKKTN